MSSLFPMEGRTPAVVVMRAEDENHGQDQYLELIRIGAASPFSYEIALQQNAGGPWETAHAFYEGVYDAVEAFNTVKQQRGLVNEVIIPVPR